MSQTGNARYLVVFTSKLKENIKGYVEMNDHLMKEVQNINGFVGIESVRDDLGISVSYWTDLESINEWKANMHHKVAKTKGRSDWYLSYDIHVCEIIESKSYKA